MDVKLLSGALGAEISGIDLKDNKCVGYITSGGYAHHVQKSMALGYVPTELSKHDTTLQVEINGKIYQANVIDKPLYDANGGKMKS